MSNVQFIQRNPAMESFRAGVSSADAERRNEQADFRQRANDERALAADKAIRSGIGAYYATQQGGGTPAPAAPPPQPGMTTAMPAAVAPRGPVTAQRVPSPSAPDLAQSLTPDASSAIMPVGGTVAANAAPAMNTPAQPVAARPAARTNAGGSIAPIMGELAKAPGTGNAMMNLFSRDLTDQRASANQDRLLHAEGSKLWVQAIKDGDVDMARNISTQYQMNIPDQAYRSRQFMVNARMAANLAKTLGVKDDHASVFVDEFLKARMQGAPEDQAAQTGAAAVRAAGGANAFEVKGRFTDEHGNVQFYDKRGNVQASGSRARPLVGAGGRGSATVQNREDMSKRIKTAYPGIDETLVQRMIINPKAQITPQDIMRQRAKLQSMKDNFGRPVYKDQASLDAAVKQVVSGAQQMASTVAAPAAGAPAPGGAARPAAAAPGQRPPLTAFEQSNGDDEDDTE
jgi:hypothetical protein